MDIKDLKRIVTEADTRRNTLIQEQLPYGRNELDPVLSKRTLDYHYGKLAAAYVKRYNNKEGDDSFNYGGAILHNLYFAQLQEPSGSNKPMGAVEQLINSKYTSFDKFKTEFENTAMGLQGSGWLYLDSKGAITIIHNHEYRKGMDIVLLIDWWEHAWALDYEHDKIKYLKNIWRIINWSIVNDRLQGVEK